VELDVTSVVKESNGTAAPNNSSASSGSSLQPLSRNIVKEIVLPAWSLHSIADKSKKILSIAGSLELRPPFYNVFRVSNGTIIRLLPVLRPCIVLNSPVIDFGDLLGTTDFEFEFMGAGSSDIRMTASSIVDIDLRACVSSSSHHVTPHFNECHRAITEGTLNDIQSSRILGGDGSVIETKYGTAGDYWSEYRAMAKRPSLFFR